MDNCDSHGRSSSTGSELKRVYEYSSRFCSAVVIYFHNVINLKAEDIYS